MTDQFPTNKPRPDPRKLRGGFYTPVRLAQYLADWAIRSPAERLLEPSCGDGAFVAAALQKLSALPALSHNRPASITAVEIDGAELEKGRARVSTSPQQPVEIEWINADFFEHFSTLRRAAPFTAIVGNPPFIRFQHFPNGSRDHAFFYLNAAGYRPTKLANAWCAFVQLSIELLVPGGRLAMVVPAEFLQVTYADELRRNITRLFSAITVVSFRRLVFPGIQQEVVLLLCEDRQLSPSTSCPVTTIEYQDGEDLLSSRSFLGSATHDPSKLSLPGMKWTGLFLSDDAYTAIERASRAPGIDTLGSFAQVDVGVVTGNNSFFLIDEETRSALNARRYTTPIIARTNAIRSVLFNDSDFHAYRASKPAYLLNLAEANVDTLSTPLRDYIGLGERAGVHKGYKCRVRKKWYAVPSIYIPDAFLYRQIHRFPLLSVNAAQVTSTDTIHRVRFLNGASPHELAATAFNSLTLAWGEVAGRSYGGGVLELEPSEAELLPLPYSQSVPVDPIKVDYLLRAGRETQALDYVDDIVLKDYLGLDPQTLAGLRSAWTQLRDRRIRRK